MAAATSPTIDTAFQTLQRWCNDMDDTREALRKAKQGLDDLDAQLKAGTKTNDDCEEDYGCFEDEHNYQEDKLTKNEDDVNQALQDTATTLEAAPTVPETSEERFLAILQLAEKLHKEFSGEDKPWVSAEAISGNLDKRIAENAKKVAVICTKRIDAVRIRNAYWSLQQMCDDMESTREARKKADKDLDDLQAQYDAGTKSSREYREEYKCLLKKCTDQDHKLTDKEDKVDQALEHAATTLEATSTVPETCTQCLLMILKLAKELRKEFNCEVEAVISCTTSIFMRMDIVKNAKKVAASCTRILDAKDAASAAASAPPPTAVIDLTDEPEQPSPTKRARAAL